jgi:hypothetical protein
MAVQPAPVKRFPIVVLYYHNIELSGVKHYSSVDKTAALRSAMGLQ